MHMPDDAYLDLSAKLDKVIDAQTGASVDIAEIKSEIKDIADHEQRIRDLEKFRWKWVGICAVIAFVIPVLVTVVTQILIGV